VPPSIKLALASAFDATGLSRMGLGLQASLLRPHVRALNYHDVTPSQRDAFEAQLRFYAEHFVPVGWDDLLAFHAGHWPHRKPGLILSFDDGLRSHAELVAPLLERHGFSGWFMVPVGFVDAPAREQAEYARQHQIHPGAPGAPDERAAVTWDELRRMDGRHVIGCHTQSHRRLSAALSQEELGREILGAKRRLEEGLGHPVPVFAWVGGEEQSYSATAARAIRDAGFAVSFMTNSAAIRPGCDLLALQRTNVEASFPPSLMRLSLSGIFDMYYTPKRRRVNRLTAPPRPSLH
jgi:peptidoglycan/xylan/chitin deacetylase (PgdA/CDA1 family)